ncbi:MAG: YhbY family RNA-binding protein [Clostridiales bacterium]|jgi:RNA-binding protein|nr:YhbY family RNA-binding protein [Clostridiales bacterium]
MLTSKQRKELEALANSAETIFQIGKGGVNENLITSVKEALMSRELVKVAVLNNSELKAKELIGELAQKTAAEPVAARGNKIILYKLSDKDGIRHLLS